VTTVLGLIAFGYGLHLGVRSGLNKIASREGRKSKSKGRIDQTIDAPAEMTPAELKAMGRWFKQ
jgi:hypothetical protein